MHQLGASVPVVAGPEKEGQRARPVVHVPSAGTASVSRWRASTWRSSSSSRRADPARGRRRDLRPAERHQLGGVVAGRIEVVRAAAALAGRIEVGLVAGTASARLWATPIFRGARGGGARPRALAFEGKKPAASERAAGLVVVLAGLLAERPGAAA